MFLMVCSCHQIQHLCSVTWLLWLAAGELGYPYDAAYHGLVSDWALDLVVVEYSQSHVCVCVCVVLADDLLSLQHAPLLMRHCLCWLQTYSWRLMNYVVSMYHSALIPPPPHLMFILFLLCNYMYVLCLLPPVE